MQGQEYLNQISASSKPAKKSSNGILSSKFFLVGAVGLILLVLIIIIGAMLNGNKDGEKNLSYALIAHLNGTTEEIGEFQEFIKTSSLRSDVGSLGGILSNTKSKLTAYLEAKYKFKEKDIGKKTLADAEAAKTALHDELFEAKINGVLDRNIAHKMAYEVSMFMIEESKILKSTRNEELTALLQESYSSLENLYPNFDGFSEGE